MAIEIINCEQRSPEWYEARRGRPTASMFKAVLARGEGKTRDEYMRKLAGEIISGIPMVNYVSDDMVRGRELEDEACAQFALLAGCEMEKVGFVKNGKKGASPDRFIGNNKTLEMKTAAPHIMVELLRKGLFPVEHTPQCQGTLWVCEREVVEFGVYSRGFPVFRKIVPRDEMYIRRLADAVNQFNDELDEMVEQVRRYGERPKLGSTSGDRPRASVTLPRPAPPRPGR